jgi:hypothetical protein
MRTRACATLLPRSGIVSLMVRQSAVLVGRLLPGDVFQGGFGAT